MQKGIQHENGSFHVRLSLPKKLKEYMAHTYDIRAAYLYLKNPVFSNMDIIKQIKIYPPANDGTSRILVIYEVEDVLPEEDNGHYLSIDLGLHNLMTCYDNAGKTFIIGREYLSLSYFYNKEIARVQSQWDRIQVAWNAVGAYNILRKYHAVSGKEIDMPVTGLSSTKTIKVAV